MIFIRMNTNEKNYNKEYYFSLLINYYRFKYDK